MDTEKQITWFQYSLPNFVKEGYNYAAKRTCTLYNSNNVHISTECKNKNKTKAVYKLPQVSLQNTDLLCTVDCANKPLIVLADAVERVVTHAYPWLHCLLTHFHQLLGQSVHQDSHWTQPFHNYHLTIRASSESLTQQNYLNYRFSCALPAVLASRIQQSKCPPWGKQSDQQTRFIVWCGKCPPPPLPPCDFIDLLNRVILWLITSLIITQIMHTSHSKISLSRTEYTTTNIH